MQNLNKRAFEILNSKTKIYLAIIAILLIIICCFQIVFIMPAVIFFGLVCFYAIWTNNKRKAEISEHIQELTISLDSAAKSSLINSPFPLIIIETNGNFIWKSSKFVNEFEEVELSEQIDSLLIEIKAEIEEREKDKSKNKIKDKTILREMVVENKTYNIIAQYVKSKQHNRKNEEEYMLMIYFIDNTENLKIQKKYKEAKTCIGIIMIDNYEEIMQRIPAEEKPRISAEIEKSIYDWASKTKGLIIKSERATFVYVFEKKYLEKLKEDKFEILDTVKNIKVEGSLQITLSIAIAAEGGTQYEKYKSANAAMDIALGRGGDQAVIREEGKYAFFGGRAQELEKRTKVKARIVAHAIEELIYESKNVIIMGHKNEDIDAIGSSLGMYRLAKTLGKEAYIVNDTAGLTVKSLIESVQKEEQEGEIFISKEKALDSISQESLLIVVDTHRKSYTAVPELLEKTSKIAVIDHHRRSTDYIDNATITFHEVYASSAAELVTELLQYVEIPVELETVETESLYAGIMMDTKNFTFKTGVRTFEAAAYLRKCGVDIIKVKKWFQSDLESYKTISQIVKEAEIINENIAVSIYEKTDKDANLICAKAADELLTISDITASFVIGDIGEKVCISGRSIGDVNVQVILEHLRRRRTHYLSRSTSTRHDQTRSKTRINQNHTRRSDPLGTLLFLTKK